MATANGKRNAKRIRDALAGKFETKQTVSVGGAVGSGKIFISGQLFDGTITGAQEVVNAGRPAAAKYVAKTGGGTTIVSTSGGSTSSGGGGGGSDYLLRSGALAMTGPLDVGNYAIVNVSTVDGRDLQADGVKIDGMSNADVLVLTSNANFSNERVLTFGSGFTTVDSGANNPYTVSIATPPTLSVSSVNSDSTRSHQIATSNDPGAAASILASSASGVLTLPQFIATTKVRTPLIDTASGDIAIAPASAITTFSGSRPVVINANAGNITKQGQSGGWAFGFHALGSAATELGGFGFLGSTDALTKYYVGPAYNTAHLNVFTNGNVVVGSQSDGGYKFDVNGTVRAVTSVTTPLITTATNVDLVINPAGTGAVQFPNDQKLRTSDFDSSFPIEGWQINEVEGVAGYSALTIGKIQADELAVRIFVADEVRVDRGDEFWTKSYGIVAETFTTPSSIGGTVSVMFEDSPALTGAIFTNNDWVLFRKLEIDLGLDLFNVWGQVSSYVDNGDGTQNWTFTLRSGPTGGKDIIKGSLAIDFGASGAALIHLSVIDAAGAPYIKMRKWVTNPYTPANFKTYVQLGNLGSIGNGYVTPAGYGIYIGSTAGDERFLLADDNGLQIRGASLALYNGSDQTVQMSYTGDDVWFGSSSSDKRFQWNGSSLKINNSSGSAVIQLDNDGSSYFAGVMTIGTSGEVRQGTGALGTDYTGLRIWRDTNVGRIAGYNNDVLQWYGDTNGKLLAGAGSIFLDADGATLLADTTTTHASQASAKSISFKRTGGTLVGRLTSYYLSGGDDYGLDIYTRAPGTEDAFATLGAEQAGKTYAGGAAGYPRLVAYSASSGIDYLRLYGENIDLYTGSSTVPVVELDASLVTFNQAVNVTGTFAVTGSITVTGNVDGVDIGAFKTAYDSHTHSYLPLSGGTLTGTLTSRTIAPSANNTYDVGSSSNYFNYAYIRNLVVDTVVGTPSYSHTHAASDITSGTLADARIPTTLAGRTFSSAVIVDADTGTTSNYIRWLTQTSTGKAWDLTGRAHDYATSAQQNDLLLTYYDGSTIYVALQFDSGTRVADFAQTPTVGGTTVSLSTHDHTGVYVPVARTVTAGTGLTGGGALSSNITISHDDTSSQASVNNSGSTFIQDVTLDTFGHVTALTSVDVASTLTGYLLGASTTGGTTDWNDVTNTTPNSGTTLLLGSATNGMGGSNYFHPVNFEFSSKTGTGNVTQWAVPYGNSSLNAGFYYRGRFSGSWSNWYKIWTEANDGPGSGLDSDTVDGVQLAGLVQISRQVIAGNGLTGGGALSADVTLALATPGTLTVSTTNSASAHTHAITSSSAPGAAASLLASSGAGNLTLPTFTASTKTTTPLIDTASGNLALTPAGGTVTVTGAGTFTTNVGVGTASPEGLQVNSAITDATRSVANVRVGTLGGNPRIILDGGVSATSWQIDNQSDVFRIFRSANVAATIGTDNTLSLYGNAASPDYASQVTGWRIDRQGGADFRYVYTDELHAKAFIADLEQALAGGQIITKSVTLLATAFAPPMPGQVATLTVKDLPSATGMQVFQSGDIIRLRQFSRSSGSLNITNCWGVVTSPVDNGNGTQSWTFTRSGTATYSTIAHRNTQTAAQSSSTTLVITKPTSTASGDCLIASIAYVGTRDVVAPAGWELIRTQAGTNITLKIYSRTAGGSEGSNYTWTYNVAGVATATNSSGAIGGYTNCYALRTVDTSNSQANTSSTSMVAPTVSPGSNAGMLLFIGGVSDNTRATPPASMTERADAGSSASGIYVADQLLAANTATGTKTATLASAETTAAALVVLMPNYTAASAEAGAMAAYTTVEAEAIVLDYGTTGNGFHEVNAVDGIYAANSPYSQVVTWTTHPATGSVVRTRTGNLSGLTGATAGEYGLYAGDGGDFSSPASQYLRVSTEGVSLNNVPIKVYNGSNQTVNIDSAGTNVWIGTAPGDKHLSWNGTTLTVVGSIVVTGGSGIASFTDANLDNIANTATSSKVSTTIIAGGLIQVGSGTKDSSLNGWHISSSEIVGQASGVDQVVLGTNGKITAGAGTITADATGLTALVSSVPTVRLNGTYGLDILLPSTEGSVQAITWRETLGSGNASSKVDTWLDGDNTNLKLESNPSATSPGGMITLSTKNAYGTAAGQFILVSLSSGTDLATLNADTFFVNSDIDLNDNDISDVNTIASKSQTIAPTSTSVIGLSINMPSSTSVQNTIMKYSGSDRIAFATSATANTIDLKAFSNGSDVGSSVIIRNNNHASTPAAGALLLFRRTGAYGCLWVDNVGNLRIVDGASPVYSTDTGGVVVGSQSSSLASKNVLGEFTDYGAALQAIVDAPLYDFTYRSGAFNGEQFTGIITDYSPLFGMDNNKSLNEVTAHGYSMAAIKALHSKIEALEAQVAELQSR